MAHTSHKSLKQLHVTARYDRSSSRPCHPSNPFFLSLVSSHSAFRTDLTTTPGNQDIHIFKLRTYTHNHLMNLRRFLSIYNFLIASTRIIHKIASMLVRSFHWKRTGSYTGVYHLSISAICLNIYATQRTAIRPTHHLISYLSSLFLSNLYSFLLFLVPLPCFPIHICWATLCVRTYWSALGYYFPEFPIVRCLPFLSFPFYIFTHTHSLSS